MTIRSLLKTLQLATNNQLYYKIEPAHNIINEINEYI